MFLVLLLFGLFATLFTISKMALLYSAPFFLIGSRMLIAGILLTGQQLLMNKSIVPKINFKSLMPLFFFGIVSIYLTNIAEIWGLNNMESHKACFLYSLSPFVASLLSFIILKEKLHGKKWMGLVLGFVAILPMTFFDDEFNHTSFIFSVYDFSLIIAVFASSLGWIMLKKIIQEFSFTPLFINGVGMTLGGILALIHSYVAGESWNPLPVTEGKYLYFIEFTLLMLLVSNLICYNLYGYLLKKYSATFISLSGLVTPLFASILGHFFLGEKICLNFYISFTLLMGALLIFYKEEINLNNLSRNFSPPKF